MAKGGPWACKEEDYSFIQRACKPDRLSLGPVLLGAGPNNHTRNKLVVGLETSESNWVRKRANKLALAPTGTQNPTCMGLEMPFCLFLSVLG